MSGYRLTALLLSFLVVAGCGGRTVTPPPDDSGTAVERPQTETRPMRPTTPGEPALTPEQRRELQMQQLMATRTLYFDYDESDIKPEFLEVIEAHARNLVRNPDQSILLEGHCDERGSREYNIALGERRAQAVRSYLISLGLDGSRISTTSVGEEMATGTDEAGWARDRNVSASEN